MPVEALAKRRFGTDDGKKQRKQRKENRRRNADRRKGSVLPRLAGAAAAPGGAARLSAFHRGSRPKESFISRDSAPGQASCDVAGTRFAHPFERALPAPACPSPATHLALRS